MSTLMFGVSAAVSFVTAMNSLLASLLLLSSRDPWGCRSEGDHGCSASEPIWGSHGPRGESWISPLD